MNSEYFLVFFRRAFNFYIFIHYILFILKIIKISKNRLINIMFNDYCFNKNGDWGLGIGDCG